MHDLWFIKIVQKLSIGLYDNEILWAEFIYEQNEFSAALYVWNQFIRAADSP